MQRLPVLALALVGLASPSFAQGADSCAAPTVINGMGTYAWSNTTATASPEVAPACVSALHRDVWFRWRAPFTEYMQVATCGVTAHDTVIAVYEDGTCPTAPALACSDDACGTQSSASFPAVQNVFYLIRIGQRVDGPGGSGSFTIHVGDSPPCGPNAGADVTVADVVGVSNYAAVAGIDAIALGTVVSNRGSTHVDVLDTNRHPISTSHLYRYEELQGAGRFEQLGMSWVHHTTSVVPATFGCTCFSNVQWRLSAGCVDAVAPSVNGTQSTLGPRWQVDASTGTFPYPAANPPIPQATGRRLEFLAAEVQSSDPEARYFGESHFLAIEETDVARRNNNTSWRELAVTGGPNDYSFATLGSSFTMMSAIRVWQLIDPQVLMTDVQVPNDGLFVTGARAYQLDGGGWRYEYAVYNMNSHRSGGSFSVPVPSTASITNVGFHGVVHRNGDGPGNQDISSASWTFTHAGGFATWTTEPESQNVRANALRWGTTYNFRFDSPAGPVDATGSLGLWRTGSPAAMDVPVRAPVAAQVSATCFGDGTGAACPCGNTGAPGSGCANSVGGGGVLTSTGWPSVTSDSLVLRGSGMPNSSCLYFQGTSLTGGGSGIAFGDGLRCAGGGIIRLATRMNTGGSSSYPSVGETSVSVRGACAAGNVRFYQSWYRNAANFCTPSTFNLSNGWQVTWQT